MKTRLAKKICSTPIDKIAPRWLRLAGGGKNTQVEKALKICRRKHKTDHEQN